MWPAKSLGHRHRGIRVPATINNTFNRYSLWSNIIFITVFQFTDPDGETGIFMGWCNFITIIIFLPLIPFTGIINSLFRELLAHTKPVRLSIINQNIGENNLAGSGQSLVNLRIIIWINITDNSKNTRFYIDSSYFTIYFFQIGNIISNNSISGDHCRTGLSTGTGESPCKIAYPAIRAMNTTHKHVLGKPAFI